MAHVTTLSRPRRQDITQYVTLLPHSWPSARLAGRWLVIQPHTQTAIRGRKAQLSKTAIFFSTPDDLFPSEVPPRNLPAQRDMNIYHHTQKRQTWSSHYCKICWICLSKQGQLHLWPVVFLVSFFFVYFPVWAPQNLVAGFSLFGPQIIVTCGKDPDTDSPDIRTDKVQQCWHTLPSSTEHITDSFSHVSWVWAFCHICTRCTRRLFCSFFVCLMTLTLIAQWSAEVRARLNAASTGL